MRVIIVESEGFVANDYPTTGLIMNLWLCGKLSSWFSNLKANTMNSLFDIQGQTSIPINCLIEQF